MTDLALTQIAQATLPPVAPPTTGPVDADAAARFSQLMAQPTERSLASALEAVNAIGATSPSSATGATRPAELVPPADAAAGAQAVGNNGKASLGDTILGGLQNLSDDFRQASGKLEAVLGDSGMTSTADLLKMQFHMVQMSLNNELLGKVVSRTTQNIDQLVKLQ